MPFSSSDMVIWSARAIASMFRNPFGAAMNKGLTIKMGQTNAQKYLEPVLKKIEGGEIDLSFVITHRIKLDDAPKAYKTFRDREDGCIKVVIKPGL